ncbi:uncharacterized protein [Gossypium hirsutum]|uniref:Gag-Pol polyprotein n=1 Tax=Gossypium hirsutum TaxID=3635 RepID=A0ABM2YKI0_GOSHI|nr:uncharacterized protein LOC121203761 [Gossypium hirsutum]
MDEWFEDYLRNCPNIPKPPPPIARSEEEMPQGMAPVRIGKALVDKLRKYEVEEFRAKIDDDAEQAEFWLENTVRVLDELSCTLEECLKCVVSLLKDTTYHWWKTASSVTYTVPTKKSRSHQERSNSSVGYSGKARSSKRPNQRSFSPMIVSVESVGNQKLRCNSCKPPGYPRSSRGGRSVAKDSTTRSEARALARTYAICAREEASAPDVITGTFSLHNVHVIALIDLGSTHSYICMKLEFSMNMSVEPTEFVIKVLNPLGKSILVDKVCKNCALTIQSHCFLANLMLLPFDEFDVILGMDWLDVHDVITNCGSKYMRKGYEAYLAFVLNSKESELKIELVPIVREYPDVFSEELPGLPIVREVEFGIELVPRTTPISIAP